jgi:hypothetical protein
MANLSKKARAKAPARDRTLGAPKSRQTVQGVHQYEDATAKLSISLTCVPRCQSACLVDIDITK